MTTREWRGWGWSIEVADTVAVRTQEMDWSFAPDDAALLHVQRRWFRWHLLEDGRQLSRLRGSRREEAERLDVAIRRVANKRLLDSCVAWHADLAELLRRAKRDQRWITTEHEEHLLRRSRPQRTTSEHRGDEPCSTAMRARGPALVSGSDRSNRSRTSGPQRS